MREQVEQENQHIHDTIAQLKKDLEQYWNQAPVIINGGQLVNSNTIKPKMWPKFRESFFITGNIAQSNICMYPWQTYTVRI